MQAEADGRALYGKWKLQPAGLPGAPGAGAVHVLPKLGLTMISPLGDHDLAMISPLGGTAPSQRAPIAAPATTATAARLAQTGLAPTARPPPKSREVEPTVTSVTSVTREVEPTGSGAAARAAPRAVCGEASAVSCEIGEIAS